MYSSGRCFQVSVAAFLVDLGMLPHKKKVQKRRMILKLQIFCMHFGDNLKFLIARSVNCLRLSFRSDYMFYVNVGARPLPV